jgi:chromosome partitioning protein
VTTPVIAFFNNKGGVGKTSLAYHLAWMLDDLGVTALAADLDPQATLSTYLAGEESLEQLWLSTDGADTVYEAFQPLLEGIGDVSSVTLSPVGGHLQLLAGDLNLSLAEEELSTMWPRCLTGDKRAFRVTSALWRILQDAAQRVGAAVILVDLGPNLGALNRAALVAADWVVVPLAPDLASLRGMQNEGAALRRWRLEWAERRERRPEGLDLQLPEGRMQPLGYVVQQHAVRLDRPVRASQTWLERIPETYREAVLAEPGPGSTAISEDANCLGMLKNYRSLVPLAREARKPIFALREADGALGGHQAAVQDAYRAYKELARRILVGVGSEERD